jgi:hypothetical protein
MTRRHDAVAGVLAKYIVLSGGVCVHERKLFCTSASKPDLSGTLVGDKEFHLDVTIRHPRCGSYVGISKRQLGVAQRGADQKTHKYAAVCHFAPFAMETYGGLHHVARDFVQQVRKALYHKHGYAMSQRFACALAVGLQKGNVRVLCSDNVPREIDDHEIGLDCDPLGDSDSEGSPGDGDHDNGGDELGAPWSQGVGLKTLEMCDRPVRARPIKRNASGEGGLSRRVRVE